MNPPELSALLANQGKLRTIVGNEPEVQEIAKMLFPDAPWERMGFLALYIFVSSESVYALKPLYSLRLYGIVGMGCKLRAQPKEFSHVASSAILPKSGVCILLLNDHSVRICTGVIRDAAFKNLRSAQYWFLRQSA